MLGVRKGVVVSTLVFCSLATVRTDIRLPSRAGRILSAIFVYFDVLFGHRRRIHRKHVLRDIDQILCMLYTDYTFSMPPAARSGITAMHIRHSVYAVLFFATHMSALLIARTHG